jgi:hypothetical protein
MSAVLAPSKIATMVGSSNARVRLASEGDVPLVNATDAEIATANTVVTTRIGIS